MGIYYVIAFTAFLLALAGTHLRQNSKLMELCFYGFAVLIFCYFAGARAYSVGSDTAGYGLETFYAALNSDFSLFVFDSYRTLGPLYKTLCWLSSNIGGTFFWYMFFVQLFTAAPVCIAAYRGLERRYVPVALLVYGLVFYPMSFNMMRQMISMSVLLMAFISANDRRPVSFCVYVLLAMTFHTAAIIGAFIYPLVIFSNSISNRFSNGLRVLFICGLGVVLVALAPQILSFTDSIGFYSAYTSGEAVTSGGGLRMIIMTTGIAIIIALLGWSFIRKTTRVSRLAIVGLLATVLFGIVCLPLSLISMWLYRVGFFFLYVAILAIPTVVSLVDDSKTRLAFAGLIVFLLMLWSYDYYSIQESHQVIPYLINFGVI